MKKALQKNNNSKEQGNAERLTQENNFLRNKVQVWWHKSISLASNQGAVMASFVLGFTLELVSIMYKCTWNILWV